MTYNFKVSVTCDQGEVLEREYGFVSFDEGREIDLTDFFDSAEKYAQEAGYDKVYANEEEADMAEADFSNSTSPTGEVE